MKAMWIMIPLMMSLAACTKEPERPIWEYHCVNSEREAMMEAAIQAAGQDQEHKVANEDGALSGEGTLSWFITQEANKLGKEGWEMVGYAMNDGMNSRYLCFKRVVQ